MEDAADLVEAQEEEIAPGWYPEPGNPKKKRYWDGDQWGEKAFRVAPTGRANRLAVVALICACVGPIFVGGILATVFGSVALDEIEASDGAERGHGMAQWAIGLGLLNVALSIAAVVGVVLVLTN